MQWESQGMVQWW